MIFVKKNGDYALLVLESFWFMYFVEHLKSKTFVLRKKAACKKYHFIQKKFSWVVFLSDESTIFSKLDLLPKK